MRTIQSASGCLLGILPFYAGYAHAAQAAYPAQVLSEASEVDYADGWVAQAIAPSDAKTIVTTQDSHTRIEGGTQVNSNLFHQFESFNVDVEATADFIAPAAVQSVIGQVSGGSASYIDGTLQVSGSDADLYLINPAGVLFGPDSRLNVGGSFTATTADQVGFGEAWLSVGDTDDYSAFDQGPTAYGFTSDTPSSVVNQGDLAVPQQQSLQLIGGTVVNAGSLSAPAGNVTLTAVPGERLVRLDTAGSLLNVEVSDEITSPTTTFDPLALPALLTGGLTDGVTGGGTQEANALQVAADGSVLLTSGSIDVSSPAVSHASAQPGGQINLLGASIDIVNSTLEASGKTGGGTIRLGGDYQGGSSLPTAEILSFDANSIARADALSEGNGGQVILWSDGVTQFAGEISAQGQGAGGLVETSGLDQLIVDSSARVSTYAPSGALGTWLLDPADLSVIDSGGTGVIAGGTNSPTGATTIDASTITTALNGSNVTLQADNSISIEAAIDASANASDGTLALAAPTLNLNEAITLRPSTGSSLSGSASTVNVGTNGNIQNAVDAVATGGTVNLAGATYLPTASIVTDRDLTLRGQGRDNTVISGVGAGGSVFRINGGRTTLESLTIRDGESTVGGGGIYVDLPGALTLTDSLLENNSNPTLGPEGGGAIYFEGGITTSLLSFIQSSELSNNSAAASGGAIRLNNAHTLTITDSVLQGNTAGEEGGAITQNTSGTLTIDGSQIENNVATSGSGGGISVLGGGLNITDSIFSNNRAESGIGGAIRSTNGINISSTLFEGNRAISGGAITVRNAGGNPVSISQTDFTNNTATDSGGGLFLSGGGALPGLISEANFTNNTAVTRDGGGLFYDGALSIERSTFNVNTAGGSGGAISSSTLFNPGLSLSLDSSTLSGNQAAGAGGALQTNGNASLLSNTIANNRANSIGGGFSIFSGSATLENTLISGNSAATNPDVNGSFISAGNNLVTTRGSSTGYIATDLADGTDPLLASLSDNGGTGGYAAGSVLTHALRSGSPAINAGTGTGNDQRGASPSGIQDIGAYERQTATNLEFLLGEGNSAVVDTPFIETTEPFPLKIRVTDSFGTVLDNEQIEISAPASGASALLNGGTTTFNGASDADGLLSLSAQANTITGSYNVSASTPSLATDNITLTNTPDVVSQLVLIGFPTGVTAGDLTPFTVEARDQFGNLNPSYTGTLGFTSSDLQAQLPGNTTISGGTGIFNGELRTAGIQNLTATDTVNNSITTTQADIFVSPDVAANLNIVSGNGQSTVVDTAFTDDLTVQLTDRFGNGVFTNNLIIFTAQGTDAQATFPGGFSLTATNTDASGVASVSVNANQIAGTHSVRAEISNLSLSTLFDLENIADVASQFVLSGLPGAVTAGDVKPFTLTAQDQFGNLADNYAGTVDFTSSDTQALLPTSSILTAGIGNFSGELRTAGTQNITVTDTVDSALTTTQSGILVSPDVAANLDIVAGNNQSAVVDTLFDTDLIVSVSDQFGNAVSGETVDFTGLGTTANGTPTTLSIATDAAGQASTALQANTIAGSYTLSASSGALSTLFDLENVADVASQFVLSGFPSNVTAGDINPFTLTAQDQFGNLADSYTGTIDFTSIDTQAQLPTSSMLTAGIGNFSSELRTAGTQSLTVTDSVNSALTTTQSGILVSPDVAANLDIVAGNNQSAVVDTLFSTDLIVSVSDQFGNAVSGETVDFTGLGTAANGTPTTLSIATDAAGQATTALQANTIAGSYTLRADSGALSTLFDLENIADVASQFVLSGFPSNVTAGNTNPFTLTAQDQFGNLADSYAGTVAFISSDGQAQLPISSTLSAGIGNFTGELRTAGTQNLTVTDTVNGALTTTQSGIVVSPDAAANLDIVAGNNQSTVVDTLFSTDLIVSVSDQFGNAVSGETVDFTGLGTTANGTPTAASVATDAAGQATTALQANTVAGSYALRANSGALSTLFDLENIADVASQFVLSGFPNAVTAGDISPFTLTAQDQFGNLADSYAGTVGFTSSDGQAQLPNSSMLTAGIGNFTGELRTAGTQSLTVTDSVNSSLTTTQSGIVVSPDVAANLDIVAGNNQSAVVNTTFLDNLTVAVSDRFGNAVSGETVNFTGLGATANGTPTAASVTTDTAGQASTALQANTISGSYTLRADSGALSTLFNLENVADVASQFVLSGFPNAVTAGDVNPFTLTAQDQFGNLADSYTGTIDFTSSDGQAQLPTRSTLAAGIGNFSSELRTAGTQSLTVTDAVNSALTTTQINITVSAGAASELAGITGDGQSAVLSTLFPQGLTVEVRDRFGNPVPGETVQFSVPTSGPSSLLRNPTAATNALGQATTALRANLRAGQYQATASVNGLTRPFTLTNEAITVNNIPLELITNGPYITDGWTDLAAETRATDLSQPIAFDAEAFAAIEQSLAREFEEYWQMELGSENDLAAIQQTLSQAELHYQSRSAMLYALFVPSSNASDSIAEHQYSPISSRRLLQDDVRNDTDQLMLLLIPPEGAPVQQIVDVSRQEIVRQAQLLRIEVSDPFFEESYKPLARQLYSWLVAPVGKQLQQSGIDNIMYVLDEGLRTLPLAAMMNEDQFVIERYGISAVPSFGLLETDLGSSPAAQSVLAGGAEEFSDLEDLPAVPIELGLIETASAETQILLNENFQISTIATAQADDPKPILHLATHANFSPGAIARSYIQFWDKKLTLDTLSSIDLETLELLILSACRTAIDSYEAELGFAGLAAATGSESAMGSLWNVSDLGTMALMGEFYNQLSANPLRFSALQAAQLSMIRGETRIQNKVLITQNGDEHALPTELVDEEESMDFSHPFFWSGFSLVGNPWW